LAGASRSLRADLTGASKKDILDLAAAHSVRFLRLTFTDILGVNKNVEIPSSQFTKALDGDIMFDGSSIEGFVRIEESDMLLTPDLMTFRVFPDGDPTSAWRGSSATSRRRRARRSEGIRAERSSGRSRARRNRVSP